jgi:hypothetical protein
MSNQHLVCLVLTNDFHVTDSAPLASVKELINYQEWENQGGE